MMIKMTVSLIFIFTLIILAAFAYRMRTKWREFLPWHLIREIENNHDVSVFSPIMTLGAEVAGFLILAAIILAAYIVCI